jgi:hypothetical protein
MPRRLAAPASLWPGKSSSKHPPISGYKASSRIIGGYDRGTLAPQTLVAAVPRMPFMDQQQSRQEENKEMTEMNIQQFMAIARFHLFGLLPVKQPALATIPVRPTDRR